MEKEKITSNQLFSLIASCNIGGAILFVPSLTAAIAKQDAWISALLSMALGPAVIWIYWYLGSQYPSSTLVDMICNILGKWLGIPIAASFVFLCFTFTSRVPWYVNNFVTDFALADTPPLAVNAVFVAAVAVSALYGIETIGRASQILLFFSSTVLIIAMLLVSPNSRIENLQPVFENGFLPVVQGSVYLLAFNTMPAIILMMVYPLNVERPGGSKLPLITGSILSSFFTFVVNLMCLLVLGGVLTAKSSNVTYRLAKEINLAAIFSRLEFLVGASWILTQFILAATGFYSTATGLSRLFGLKEYKRLVLPLALVTLVLSLVTYPDEIYQGDWVRLSWPPLIATYGFVLPVILAVVHLIKKHSGNKYGQTRGKP